MIDSHTHLDLVPIGAEAAVAAATAAGVGRLLTVGTDLESSATALANAERHRSVWAAVGLHPNSADRFDDDILAELTRLAEHPRCVAIGETGLDYYREGAPPDVQASAFRAHVALARRTSKPLIVHTRAADQDTLDLLAEHAAGVEVLLHCFSMPARLAECVERGYWISFAGNVTYPRNRDLAAAAAHVPLDKLLLETDAPYLTPQVVRKERNQPAFVVHTAAFVADARGLEYVALEAAVEDNARRLLGW